MASLEIIGQSCTLWRGPLRDALIRGDAAPLRSVAQVQIAAGADALDLNAGVGADPDSAAAVLVQAVRALRGAQVRVPLWLDCGNPLALSAALDGLRADGPQPAVGPLVVNAIAIDAQGRPASPADEILLAAAAPAAAVVYSPRALLQPDTTAEQVRDCAARAMATARAAGVRGTVYLDALAMPAIGDTAAEAVFARVSAATAGDAAVLVAVENVTHGTAGRSPRAALRMAFAARAYAAGARAFIAPIEDRSLSGRLRSLHAGAGGEDAVSQHWLRTRAHCD